MKKEKVLALLLTAAMCTTTAAPVFAADFADDTAETMAVTAENNAETETESTDELSTNLEETDPEVITEESSGEYEENQVSSEAEAFQMADTQSADFSDAITEEDTDAVGGIRTTVIPANNAEVTGTIKRQLAPDYYRIDLTTGGTLTLKGSKTGNVNFYGTLMDAVTDKELGTFDKRSWAGDCLYDATFELAKGSYLIKIDNGTSESSTETYVMKTKFRANAGLTFAENSNDDFESASSISAGKVIKGHLATNNTSDYYKIQIPATGEYNFITKNTAGNNSTQYLYDVERQQLERITTYGSREQKMELTKGTYYYHFTTDGYTKDVGDYWFKVVGHTHSYKTSYSYKATPYNNGSITKKCSGCGKTISETVYRPETVQLSTRSYTYNGKSKKPSVTVIAANGKALSSSSYTVSYEKDTVSAGRHKVKITLKGRYSGTMGRYYVINPKATSIQSVKGFKKGFQVNIKAQSKRNATGYQVQYSTRTDFSNAKTTNVSGTVPQFKGLKGKTNYYVRVRVYKKSGKKTYYSSWSSATRVKTK